VHLVEAVHARGRLFGEAADRVVAVKSCGYFSWIQMVRSPPSSRIMFGPLPPLKA
jgi:hypothetical protein